MSEQKAIICYLDNRVPPVAERINHCPVFSEDALIIQLDERCRKCSKNAAQLVIRRIITQYPDGVRDIAAGYNNVLH